MSIVAMTVGYFAIQWNRGAYLGKSPEQIVALGREKWMELYTKKLGSSTMAMVDADIKFGEALKSLNDRSLKRLSSKRRRWLESMRMHTLKFGADAHVIGYEVSGGGSIWRNFEASIYPDVEQTIAECIVNKPLPMYKLMSFESMFADLDKTIKAHKDEMQPNGFQSVLDAYQKLRVRERQFDKVLVTGTQNDRTRFNLLLRKELGVASAKDMLGEGAQS